VTPPLRFQLEARSGAARAGLLETPHGPVHTPAFMVVGTHAAVRAMTVDQVRATGAEVVLANTYHLALRPGESTVEKLGGLHGFMRWSGPILTDSGGFQVFSLPSKEIGDHGVRFKNEVTGEAMELTPERSIEIQNRLGADVIMAFDECTPFPADEATARSGVRRTLAWLERSVRAHARPDAQALFGIVQGSVYPALRAECAKQVTSFDLPGYAIGGVSVGEGHELLCRVTEHTAPRLPEIPTRYARSASVFTARGRIRLTQRRYRRDAYPIDPSCDCAACAQGHSRAYLHHLFAANEILSAILASIHNVRFYQRLVANARRAIVAGDFDGWRRGFLAEYAGGPDEA
jgi:queuine tRNA-ribosyltransferase